MSDFDLWDASVNPDERSKELADKERRDRLAYGATKPPVPVKAAQSAREEALNKGR